MYGYRDSLVTLLFTFYVAILILVCSPRHDDILRWNLLFSPIGHSALSKDVNISFSLSLSLIYI